MGNGKPTKCPICREKLSSGKALGGHMSKHKAARLKRAATLASKEVRAAKTKEPAVLSPEARERLREVRERIAAGAPAKPKKAAPAGNVTVDTGASVPRAAQDLRLAAKRKREEAAKVEALAQAQIKARRDEADELDRLAERVEHLL